ncbi:MAG: type 4a pilus biogenesis protein PilO [Polyangiaceae bacterium]
MAAQQTFLDKLPPWGRWAAGAGLGVIFALAYFLILYTDVSSKITAVESQRKQLDKSLADTKAAEASYLKDKDDLGRLQQHEKELNKALPADTQIAAFLSSIQQVSNVAGVDLEAWQPQEEKKATFYSKVPMKLELTGRFFQIAKFAYEVGKLERIINVENIELSDPKVEGDEIHIKAKCLATTFHTPAGASPASSAAPGGGATTTPPPAPPPTGAPK